MAIFRVQLVLVVIALAGCVRPRVDDRGLPPLPPPRKAQVVLALDGVPAPMLAEARAFTAGSEVREVDAGGTALERLCPGPGWLVVRPRLGRTYLDTNSGDRNAVVIYASARVLLLPLAAATVGLTKWYGHAVGDGSVDRVRCGTDRSPARFAASALVVTEGRWIARGDDIDEVTHDALVRAVTRKLLALAMDDAAGWRPSIVVREFATDGAEIDYDEPQAFGLEVAEEIAAELRRRGRSAEAMPLDAGTPAGVALVSGRVTRIVAGSRVKRLFLLRFAGSARFAAVAHLTDRARERDYADEQTGRFGGAFGGSSRMLVGRSVRRAAGKLAKQIDADLAR
jgi:hypothetical protein